MSRRREDARPQPRGMGLSAQGDDGNAHVECGRRGCAARIGECVERDVDVAVVCEIVLLATAHEDALHRHLHAVKHLEDGRHAQGTVHGILEHETRFWHLFEDALPHLQNRLVDFHKVLEIFNLLPPTIEPTATGHILEQIQLTEKLLKDGFAYESNGSVYFDVLEYNKRGLNYGELSRRNIEELFANTRDLDGQGEKRNPQDFALWKKASPAHIMRWASPWGDGFPGWHLECTVMSTKYLGNQFDIHGGGMDLKFPHHECEIAQGKAGHGESPVRYWMHANMLTMNGQRMSKSTGNYILPMQLISGENSFFEKPFAPAVIRFCFMQAHYRSVLDISNEAMLAAEKGFSRLMEAVKTLNEMSTDLEHPGPLSYEIDQWKQKCYDALLDDFNSPILIAHLFEMVKWINSDEKISIDELNELKTLMNAFVFDVLGLQSEQQTANNNDKLDGVLQLLINMRMEARANKDWALSDKIRDELLAMGIQLKDGKEGTSYIVN